MTKFPLSRRVPSKHVTYVTTKNPLLSSHRSSFNGTLRRTQVLWWASGIADIHSKSHEFKETFGFMKSCAVCSEKFLLTQPFGCTECRTIVHCYCISEIKSPCVPCSSSSWKENHRKPLAVYCPSQSPKIARPVIFALSADPSSTGTYIGSKKGLASVNRSQAEILLKKFLCNLRDPLVPRTSMEPLLSSIESGNIWRMKAEIKEMPEPHQHTLAYLMIWIKRNPGNRVKYSIEIVGGLKDERIFNALVDLPIDFWKNILTP